MENKTSSNSQLLFSLKYELVYLIIGLGAELSGSKFVFLLCFVLLLFKVQAVFLVSLFLLSYYKESIFSSRSIKIFLFTCYLRVHYLVSVYLILCVTFSGPFEVLCICKVLGNASDHLLKYFSYHVFSKSAEGCYVSGYNQKRFADGLPGWECSSSFLVSPAL